MASSTDPRIQQAWQSAEKGDLDAAERLFEAANGGPDAAEATFGRGSIAARRGDVARAIDLLAQACRLDSSVALHHYQLGVALVSAGRADSAAASFRECVRIDPAFGESWFNLGHAERSRGRFDDALESFRRAADCPRTTDAAQLAVSQTLRSAGRIDDAIASIRESLARRDEWCDAWAELGLCLATKNDLRTAATCWERALEIEPRHADSRFHLGVVFGMLGELERAESCYRALLREAPQHGRARVNLAGVLMQRGQLDDAERELLSAAASPGPESAVALLAMADLRMRQERLAEAERAYRQVVQMLPRELRPRIGLVGSLLALGRGGEALREVDSAESIMPGRPECAEARAEALVLLSRLDEAMQVIDRVLAGHGPSALRHGLRGRVLEAMGRLAEARAAFEASLAIDSGFAPSADGLDRLGRA
ncbi:MAG: tetratricopeptide repeat protein [Phycisphaerae bacterium]|nr:tetratricopeptide repeat protein [Phycisphaerae bacterium]